MALESQVSPEEVYRRDVAWMDGCDCLVAEVSTPSHGVGYEIAYTIGLGKPVLCCYQRGRRVSKMITGNSSPSLRLLCYDTPEELLSGVKAFLKQTISDR
jgi:nucleoside 2-deoxyribosyltransferase